MTAVAEPFAHVFGASRGRPPVPGRPGPNTDVALMFDDRTREKLRDWCMANLTPDKPVGSVVVYRQGGIVIDGRAYDGPGVALGQASRRRRRLLNTRGIDSIAYIVEVSEPGYLGGEYWHMSFEAPVRSGRAMSGNTWKKSEHPSPLTKDPA